MQTIQLNIRTDGVAAVVQAFIDLLKVEAYVIDASAPMHWGTPKRKELAKVFATLEMVVEFARAHAL